MGETRQALIDTAMRLFAEKGYHATSIAEILKTAGVNSGSLYHYFPGKQDLLLAVLDDYHAGIDSMLLEPAWQDVGDPIGRIFALLGFYRELLVSTGFFYGCPIGSLALEIHEPDPAVRERLEANFEAWRSAVAGCIREASLDLPEGSNPESLATMVLTSMEGGVMLSRTYRSAEPFDQAVGELRCLFHALTGSKPGGN